MRAKPVDLLQRYQTLVEELVLAVPKTKSVELRTRAESLRMETNVFLTDGRGRHWRHRRTEQVFEISVRGQGTYTVKGFEEAAADLGWKMSTLRSRLSGGAGTTSFEREVDGRKELVTVTKLKAAKTKR